MAKSQRINFKGNWRKVAVTTVLLGLLVAWGVHWTPKVLSHLSYRQQVKAQPHLYTLDPLEWRSFKVGVETMGWDPASTGVLTPADMAKADLRTAGVTFFKDSELKLDPATGTMDVRNTASQLQLIEAFLGSRGAVTK